MAKKMISLEITDELREALRVEAFKRSLSISALIRQILEKELNLSEKELETK
jgi:plasmid stability protein